MSFYFQHIPPSTEYHTQQQWPSAGTGFLPHLSLWLHQWVISCQCREFTTWSHNLEKTCGLHKVISASCPALWGNLFIVSHCKIYLMLSQHEESSSFLGRWKLLKILIHNRIKCARQPFKNSNKDITSAQHKWNRRSRQLSFAMKHHHQSFLSATKREGI